ncbi:MAG: hypothetical protein U0104_00110 [Gemmatimonadales bacterium]|nr:hypothetical protein [Gemmatimonadales bacterium]
MPQENEQSPTGDLGWWVVLGLLFSACLVAYFIYSPRVAPVIRPAPAVTESP